MREGIGFSHGSDPSPGHLIGEIGKAPRPFGSSPCTLADRGWGGLIPQTV